MGIDIHCFNFLRYSLRRRKFDKTVTIGRQSVHIREKYARKALRSGQSYQHFPYCEDMLQKHFGASTVDSVDNSGYEQATILHDMNQPLPERLRGSFDTIIDGGSLEHVFDAPQALRNCSLLCRPQGQILHILPSNNFCGHGFWQFSPELFFSLYSAKHGYAETEVFLADLADTRRWFKVVPPRNGQRVNVRSNTQLYVMVRTVLTGDQFSHAAVQQSDYVYTWGNTGANQPATRANSARPLKQRIKESPVLSRLAAPPFALYLRLKVIAQRSRERLSSSNPGLEPLIVSDVV